MCSSDLSLAARVAYVLHCILVVCRLGAGLAIIKATLLNQTGYSQSAGHGVRAKVFRHSRALVTCVFGDAPFQARLGWTGI